MAEGGGAALGVTDLISGIALSRPARVAIFGALGLLIVATLVMIYFGVTDEAKLGAWVEAAVYLLGILFPALLIVAVLTLAEGGDTVVQNRTYAYMTGTLPRTLRSIEEEPAALVPLGSLARTSVQSRVEVALQQYVGSCIAHYRLKTQAGAVVQLVLELNVRKANIKLLLPNAPFAAAGKDGPARMKVVRELLPHTLAGAEMEGYRLNGVPTYEMLDESSAVAVVLVQSLDPKFITSPYERVSFAQDLMFFVKAALAEAPHLFLSARSA